MNHFEVFKDIYLFLRKVYFRLVYSGTSSDLNDQGLPQGAREQQAIDDLVSLMGDSSTDSDDEIPVQDPWKRQAHLNIRSTKLPQFRNNQWIGIFLDLVQEDLNRINWEKLTNDNLLQTNAWHLKN